MIIFKINLYMRKPVPGMIMDMRIIQKFQDGKTQEKVADLILG